MDHWRRLSAEQQSHTVLVLDSGRIYQPAEIGLIHLTTTSGN